MTTSRLCACGCGEALPPEASPSKKYLNRGHQLAARNALNAGAQPTVLKQLTGQLNAANARIDALATENAALAVLLDRFSVLKPGNLTVPKWCAVDAPSDRQHHATAVLMLSDLHLDERVDLHEMDGINEYNRAIAERRLHRIAEGLVKLLQRYVSGVELDGLVLAVLGDILTGWIHAELERTNEAPIMDSIVYWVPILASMIEWIADQLDVPVHVPAVDGNHDRLYGKPHHKQRAITACSWVIYNWLADKFEGDDRVTFGLTTAAEQIVPVYNTRLMLSHGDSFRSQGGVGGLYPSLLKWLLRRHQQYTQTKSDFDYALIGHWHSTLYGQDFFVNGSLKGYDEYAKALGFVFERPQQTLFLVTPERGVVQRLPVHAE